ncbi:MAG: endonuclease VIII [Candidatus Heimdallarchaeota archaeon]|nr:MAG: endonuclease VIII [Candidatus Heimdallarchaeota archaeon]
MIELPEAIVISKQINDELKGKTVKSAIRGQNPHRFAFTGKYSDKDFSEILIGKIIKKSWPNGNVILVQLDGYLLSLGCGGERILYHKHEKTIPKKHQLLLEFDDQTYLTVTISGWGEVRLLETKDLAKHPHIPYDKVDPLSEEFTLSIFKKLVKMLPEKKKCSAKKFFITEPGLRGIGNGVIQDIFFYSKIHPKTEMKSLSTKDLERLFETTRKELQKMVDLGGRDCEKDIFNQNGRYQRIMHSKAVNTSCPVCKTTLIKKKQYLGGAIYFCSSCQMVLP